MDPRRIYLYGHSYGSYIVRKPLAEIAFFCRPDSLGRSVAMPRLRAAGFDIANQLRARDIGSSAIFLRFQRSVMNSVVELRPAHAKNLCSFGHLKTQGRQSVTGGL
jgi:hypothetical protein